MTASLIGKVAVVTGARQGIGADTAHVLAERGATVVLADITSDGIDRHAEAITQGGGQASYLTFDLTKEAEIAEAVRTIASRHGRIDILHNNAALQTASQRQGDRDVVQLDIAIWDAAMAVNTRGPMLLCKYVIPVMIAGGGGSIIHSSSGFGLLGESTLTSYGVSKAALIQLSRFIATQYGKQGIRSNAIAIGFVLSDTGLETTPQIVRDIVLDHHLNPSLGQPRDVANVVAFLASDDSSYINGALIPVDGGFSAHQPTMADFHKLFAARGNNQL